MTSHSATHFDPQHQHAAPPQADPMARADTDMKYVLDILSRLGRSDLTRLTPASARRQPGLADALATITQAQRRELDDDGLKIKDIAIPGPEGDIPARVYAPRDRAAYTTLPMVLYIHGGGWVTGDLDACDASPRALAKKTGAVVVSVHYRQAPEHKFPAAHEDTYAAWQWLSTNARTLGANPRKSAIVGEGAGGNMALNIALRARKEYGTKPLHLALIHPIAGNDMSRPSYLANAKAKPLDPFIMQWLVRHTFAGKSDTDDARINLVERTDLAGLPPVTLILAEIDPLLSEGEELGEKLREAGNEVDINVYDGVTNGFFGLGQFVNKAMLAQSHVAQRITNAFARSPHRY
jgi:acetyl esterase